MRAEIDNFVSVHFAPLKPYSRQNDKLPELSDWMQNPRQDVLGLNRHFNPYGILYIQTAYAQSELYILYCVYRLVTAPECT